MDKEKLQKEIVDAISQIAKNEANKNNKIAIVKGEITGIDPLNCYYNFSYNNHLYSARSVLGGYSVGQKVFVAFSGEQENNIILCGEIIGGGVVAGSEERVLSSITQQYYISSSSEIEPPQNPGEGAQYHWSDERLEPTKEAPYLWTRYKYTYTDASVEYATPYVLNLTVIIDESNETITDYIDNSIGNIQSQIDKQADIWFYNGVPILNTYPANEWTTNEIKDIHIGDLYFDTSETGGKAYEFKKNQSTYLWQLVQDQEVIKALNNAAKAQDTADNKRRVFYATPVPPYDKGDLWVQGSNGDILYCNVPKKSGATYNRSDWIVASKYTDDSNLNIFKEEYTHYKEDNDRKWENTLGKITTIEGQVNENTTNIQQNAQQIIINAQETTKVKDNLSNNYYTKEQANAAIKTSANNISLSVEKTYTKKEDVKKNVISMVEQFYLSNSATELSRGSWSSSSPQWQNGKYIWRRTYVTYFDRTSEYIPSEKGVCITGNDGKNGTSGEAGVGIESVTNYYLATSSNSGITVDSPGWTEEVQTITVTKKYLWNYEKTLYTDQSIVLTKPCVIGVYGETGAAGSTGTGISSITVEFYLSTSKTTQTGGSWTTAQPTWTTGKYLWTRQKIVYKNPASTVYTTPQCDSSWEAVNEVEVGGRNLLLNSANYDDIEISVGATNINLGPINVTPGEQITVSFDIKSDTAQTNKQTALMQYFDSTSKRIESEDVWVYGNVKTEYSRISQTDNVPANAVTFKLGLRSASEVANTYSRIKIEKGNKATDWTPAPEDVQQGIDTAQNAANNAQNTANDNKVNIESNSSKIGILDKSIQSLVVHKDASGEYQSNMIQDETGWHFDITSIVNDISKSLTGLNSATQAIENNSNAIEGVQSDIDDVAAKTAYITISQKNGNPYMELGSTTSSFKLGISNTSIDFMDGTNRVAYISNQNLYIERSIIKNELQIGEGTKFIWKKRSNGNLGLRWESE